MASKRQANRRIKPKPSAAEVLRQFQSPEITEAVERLYKEYGKYALSDEETRKLVDEAMGSLTLTEALQAMRDER